jgi:hypothetical protein
MNLPGFTAESALSRTNGGYRLNTDAGMNASGVIATRQSLAVKAGCGACTELKWPNGTGTGACVQDCCDLSGNCKIQACPCGGGGSGAGFGSVFTRSFGAGSFFAR